MLIALVDLTTSAADRPAVVAQLLGERPAIIEMPGCADFRVVIPPDQDTAVTIVHEWHDESGFARYLASDEFARSGEIVRPLLTAPPVSRRYRADLLETVA